MKTFTSLLIIVAFIFGIQHTGLGQQHAGPIKWYDFEEAVELNKKEPKKFFIDMYTHWCGWCKKMDQSTFKDPVIAAYMNENFYPIKFNAERSDTVMFNGKVFVNKNPAGKRSSHDLAISLMQGRMSFPSFVFLSDKAEMITTVPGYKKAQDLEPILHYIANEAYKTEKWETYVAGFKGSVKSQ